MGGAASVFEKFKNSYSLTAGLRMSPQEFEREVNDEIKQLEKHFDHIGQPYNNNKYSGLTRYALATTSRVGGHYLGQLLGNSGSGSPLEYLGSWEIENFYRDRSESTRRPSLNDYWDGRFHAASAQGTPFGIKLNLRNVFSLVAYDALPFGPRGWKWVYLYREDVIAQAISFTLAQVTGEWHSIERARASSVRDVDLDQVENNLITLFKARAGWDALFSLFEIKPLMISYEEIDRDVLGCLQKVRSYLGLSNAQLRLAPFEMLQKQAGPLSMKIKDRFMRERLPFLSAREPWDLSKPPPSAAPPRYSRRPPSGLLPWSVPPGPG
ncbi:Stf0 family sulfotransferase [Brevundimonas sp. 2R-24]|uniref:Stf0 family sulfotransferase n=1 Tax=Peiella sedimenti TaxID=3061083 RepID=A0ABT8SP07_9CAUL|nr:Stf0 family sulfotransferase [Caulobacteraceae bacterium XZ-24]